MSVQFITYKFATVGSDFTQTCVSEFLFFHLLLLCSGPGSEGFNLHVCACLVRSLAIADERLALDIAYVDAIRKPPRVLCERIIDGTPLAEYPPAVKAASHIALT